MVSGQQNPARVIRAGTYPMFWPKEMPALSEAAGILITDRLLLRHVGKRLSARLGDGRGSGIAAKCVLISLSDGFEDCNTSVLSLWVPGGELVYNTKQYRLRYSPVLWC